jgi:hypothetical protein
LGFGNFPACATGPCPESPEGPSFSSDGSGDLYFNTSYTATGVYKIAGVAKNPPGPLNSPVSVIQQAGDFVPGFGEGTGFDAVDNLLEVDVDAGEVFKLGPPYTPGAPSPLVGGLAVPTAVALNKASGQEFVSDSGGDTPGVFAINIGVEGASLSSYISSSAFSSDCDGTPKPTYMQFDGTGHLFVITAIDGSGTCGQVWRVDPANGEIGPTVNLLASVGTAIGLALPATKEETQTVGLLAGGGSFTLGWPIGCPTTTLPCTYTFGVTYPAGMFPEGATANVTPTDATEADWTSRTCTSPNTTFCGSQIAPVAGEDGSGIVFSAKCLKSDNSPCEGYSTNPSLASLTYTVSTSWKSSQTNYCGLGPGLLKADPIGSDTWANTLTNCTVISPDPTYGTKGTTRCSSTSCLSDWANVFNIGGPVVNADPFGIDFGNVPVLGLRIQTLTLTNVGKAPLAISRIAIAPVTGGDSDDFLSLSLCPKTLGVGKKCVVLLSFFADPDDFSPQSATLTISDNAAGSPQQLVPLTALVVKRR